MDPSLHPIVDAGYMDLEHPWIQVSYINGLGMEPISSLQSLAFSLLLFGNQEQSNPLMYVVTMK